jgi:hypothetical protein
MNQTKVLRENRRRRTRKVEREGIFDGTKIMELEDEVLGEMGLITPDNPADTDVGEAEFVATRYDENR